MKKETQDWLTEEAMRALDAWTLRHRNTWVTEGADPEEIRSDLESHLWRSVEGRDNLVTLDTVEEAIAEMGLPEMASSPPVSYQAPAAGSEKSKKGFWKGFVIGALKSPFLHGAWPLLVVLFELTTGTLASLFFDPMSRTEQTIVVLLIAGLGLYGAISTKKHWSSSGMIFLRGTGAIHGPPQLLFDLPDLATPT